MPAKTMLIRDLTRYPIQDTSDTLYFEPGVNVIVGPPNTGKTQWLKILDYLLGDDSHAEESLAEEVFEKYESAVLTVSIDEQDFTIERRWKEPGFKTKVIIDGKAMDRKDFCHELLVLLDIPIVHYPQGDPYGPRTWPELGWRSLLRHIYRQQRFWGDLADDQYDSVQHACLMQFLGIAKGLFSTEYGALVQSNKKIHELKLKKGHYVSMLQEISKELIDAEDLGIALTPQSIETASDRINNEVNRIQERRQSFLDNLIENVTPQIEPLKKDTIQQLGENLAALQAKRGALLANIEKVDQRISDLSEYQRLVDEELSRIHRTEHAGELLTSIKITHCPACDREITHTTSNNKECLLCHRPIESQPDLSKPIKRLEFERHQLSAESSEAQELIGTLDRERMEMNSQIVRLNEKIHQIQMNLRPVRAVAAAIMPPEITMCDMEIGRLEERLQQLKRVSASLKKREDISTEITQIQQEVIELEGKVAAQNSKIDFEKQSDVLTDSINSYLNLIHRSKPKLWSQKPVAVDFRKRDFKFFVGERSWRSKLGGTTTLIFLMSYHYGLMSLTSNNDYNYPGLLILDFPAVLDDGSTVRDKENFVLEPFVALLRQDNMYTAQIIAAGSSFENLQGANRIEMYEIWK